MRKNFTIDNNITLEEIKNANLPLNRGISPSDVLKMRLKRQTLRSIGHHFKKGAERIRQIEAKAVCQIKFKE